MAHNTGIDFEAAYDMHRDPQQRPPVAYCRRCGDEIYSETENESNDGLCDFCFYLSLVDDADERDEEQADAESGEGDRKDAGERQTV